MLKNYADTKGNVRDRQGYIYYTNQMVKRTSFSQAVPQKVLPRVMTTFPIISPSLHAPLGLGLRGEQERERRSLSNTTSKVSIRDH